MIPDPYYGPAFHDQPILALDKVRYVGEPVAVVLASDPHVAEEAVHLIGASTRSCRRSTTRSRRMTSKAVVHDVLKPAGTFPDLKHLQGVRNTNVALDFQLRRGDAVAGVCEGGARLRAPLPHPAGDAHCRSSRWCRWPRLHRKTRSPSTPPRRVPSFVRIEIARLLGWPENRVRVRVPFLGGGFGAKLYIKLEALVAALSLLDRRRR